MTDFTDSRLLPQVYDYLASSPYGQQASVFSADAATVGSMVDILVNQVGDGSLTL